MIASLSLNERLKRLRQACRGPITRAEWWHLLLVFVGGTLLLAFAYFIAVLLGGGAFSAFLAIWLLGLPGLLAAGAMSIVIRRMEAFRVE